MRKRFLLTLGFMTRIPVKIDWEVKDGDLEKGILYFPVIGLILGGVCAAVYKIVSYVLPYPVSILCGMLTLVCLTGAFHVDGLADTMDGIYSARKRERMLEIMRDSRLGTNGAIAVLFDFAFRFWGLYSIGQIFNESLPLVFLILPVSGKMVQGMVGFHAVYAREKGLGLFIGTLSGTRVLICSLLGILFISIACGLYGFFSSCLVFCCIFLFRRYIERILGGITGDVMGAANELAEILFLMILYASYQIL